MMTCGLWDALLGVADRGFTARRKREAIVSGKGARRGIFLIFFLGYLTKLRSVS